MAETLQFAAETVYGALGLRIGVTWQIVLTPYALKGGFFQGEFVEKLLDVRQLRNSLRKLLGLQ